MKTLILQVLKQFNLTITSEKEEHLVVIIPNKYVITIYLKPIKQTYVVKAQPITEQVMNMPLVSKGTDYYFSDIEYFQNILKKLSE